MALPAQKERAKSDKRASEGRHHRLLGVRDGARESAVVGREQRASQHTDAQNRREPGARAEVAHAHAHTRTNSYTFRRARAHSHAYAYERTRTRTCAFAHARLCRASACAIHVAHVAQRSTHTYPSANALIPREHTQSAWRFHPREARSPGIEAVDGAHPANGLHHLSTTAKCKEHDSPHAQIGAVGIIQNSSGASFPPRRQTAAHKK
eukprot:4154706-Pleurochrysis_carterae.AAC.3